MCITSKQKEGEYREAQSFRRDIEAAMWEAIPLGAEYMEVAKACQHILAAVIRWEEQRTRQQMAILKEGLYLVDTQDFDEPDNDRIAHKFIVDATKLFNKETPPVT